MATERALQRQQERIAAVKAELLANTPPAETDPAVERLVIEIIGRVADKWTMLVLEILTAHTELRFTRIAEYLQGISQRMLTKTLRQMERDGLLERTVHPAGPPHLDYRLTELGYDLGAAFCGVWMWAERNREAVLQSRARYDLAPAPPRAPRSRVVI